MIKSGNGSHQSTRMKNDEWLTPPEILKALGSFDLDPCAPISRPWPMAKKHYTIFDNGIIQKWEGRVWLNPPYGTQTEKWLKSLADHGDGIALIFARTETEMFFRQVWSRADGILFLKGRISFYHGSGEKAKHNGGAPSCLVAYGDNNVLLLKRSGLEGHFVNLVRNA